MARFSVNDSYRADCFLHALQAAEQLLTDELRNGLSDEEYDRSKVGEWNFLSAFADVALVLGVTEEQWTQAFRENAAFYRERGIKLE